MRRGFLIGEDSRRAKVLDAVALTTAAAHQPPPSIPIPVSLECCPLVARQEDHDAVDCAIRANSNTFTLRYEHIPDVGGGSHAITAAIYIHHPGATPSVPALLEAVEPLNCRAIRNSRDRARRQGRFLPGQPLPWQPHRLRAAARDILTCACRVNS
ncbi:hypothetical protein FA95DRAFT_305133 [Auriscalpium vulgare]|uniref:Uncharacterized protein n=1 Tax=Auriscalpium vulgare TaxID=40419 RepID=A0ACB8RIX0_9AGAM|nr:hypothetical protein FA95DRAFT_305133 [Auriscalpium vulgare]